MVDTNNLPLSKNCNFEMFFFFASNLLRKKKRVNEVKEQQRTSSFPHCFRKAVTSQIDNLFFVCRFLQNS